MNHGATATKRITVRLPHASISATPGASSSGGRLLAIATGLQAAIFGYLLVCAFEPLRLNWGDPWSDANVLTALNFSSREGFLKTSFTDVLDIGTLTPESYRYTHYPPFAEIFYGVVRKLSGGRPLDITVYRFFAIAFSFLGVRQFMAYVARVWSDELAQWAGAFASRTSCGCNSPTAFTSRPSSSPAE